MDLLTIIIKRITICLKHLFREKKILFIISFSVIIITVGSRVGAEEKIQNEKTVLIHFSHPDKMPWQDKISHILYERLENENNLKLKIYSEFPGFSQNAEPEYLDSLRDMYRIKYRDIPIDIILAMDTPSGLFIEAYGDELFPDTPVVGIVNKIAVKSVESNSSWVGIYSEPYIAITVSSALRLFPETENIALISGSDTTDRNVKLLAEQELAKGFERYNISFLEDLAMEEILDRVSSLPRNSIVVYLLTLKDGTGKSYVPALILPEIVKASNSPVFGLWDTFIGTGIIGGYLVSTENQGSEMADKAISILNGKRPDDMSSSQIPNQYIFDWRQLRKWGVRDSRLPPESRIEFREVPLWKQYLAQIMMIAVLFSLETFLVLKLFRQKQHLGRAKATLTDFKNDLEIKVKERTRELSDANSKLQNEIAEHRKAEEKIGYLLEEKDLLLREVHHRIKNNMTTLMSLLAIQADKAENKMAESILQDTENRIGSMLVLYNKLYTSSNYQNLSLKDYIHTLLTEFISGYCHDNRINIKEDLEDCDISPEISMNIGIMLNEILSNIIKHAFPNDKKGEISVKIRKEENIVTIKISDNGIGLPEEADLQKSEGFGLNLIQILTEQINGQIEIFRGQGTRFIISFPL